MPQDLFIFNADGLSGMRKPEVIDSIPIDLADMQDLNPVEQKETIDKFARLLFDVNIKPSRECAEALMGLVEYINTLNFQITHIYYGPEFELVAKKLEQAIVIGKLFSKEDPPTAREIALAEFTEMDIPLLSYDSLGTPIWHIRQGKYSNAFPFYKHFYNAVRINWEKVKKSSDEGNRNSNFEDMLFKSLKSYIKNSAFDGPFNNLAHQIHQKGVPADDQNNAIIYIGNGLLCEALTQCFTDEKSMTPTLMKPCEVYRCQFITTKMYEAARGRLATYDLLSTKISKLEYSSSTEGFTNLSEQDTPTS